MTIASATRKSGPYAGDDSTQDFVFDFKVFADADLYCVVFDEDTNLESVLTLTTDYTVSRNADQNVSPGGTVTLVSALASGTQLTITSQLSSTQLTDLTNQGGFYPQVITNALDKLTILIQQLEERIARAITVPFSTSSGVVMELPMPEANTVIGWNATGTALRNYDTSELVTSVATAESFADVFDGTGSETHFDLTYDPVNVNNLDVSIDGITQVPITDYTLTSGATAYITFTIAPENGTKILARYTMAVPPS